MEAFSIQVVAALVEAITGGSAGAGPPPIGLYRTGPQLEQFFNGAGIDLRIGGSGRVRAVREAINEASQSPDGQEKVTRLLEQVADPREYLSCPEKGVAVLEFLNARLEPDGFELRVESGRCKLRQVGRSLSVASGLRDSALALDLGSVTADFDRALSQAESDPEGAITAACSTLESVFKCILDDLRTRDPLIVYTQKEDIDGLAKLVEARFDLSPGRHDLDPDLKRILGGLANTIRGIGALRTHGGDAHGKGTGVIRVVTRVARLAIHAASSVALFYIESWQSSRKEGAGS